MPDFLAFITAWFKELSQTLPLEAFVIVGAFIEELIGPIPSPLVLTAAGSIALTQGHTWIYVVLLAFLGGIGKVLAAWLLYILGDKAEHWLVGKWGRFLGLSHESVADLAKKFGNKGIWDDVLLFFLRAIPIMPSAPVSVLCGVLRLPLKPYLITTFLGYSVRNAFFLFVGFVGADAYRALVDDIKVWGVVLWVVSILAVLGLLGWLYMNAKMSWWETILKKLDQILRKLRLKR